MATTENQINPREALKERRLARMRQGQAAFEIVGLPSDPDIRFALVPLMEKDYDAALTEASHYKAPDNLAGTAQRDRAYLRAVLARSLRAVHDLETPLYRNGDELMAEIDTADMDHLIERFQEMTENLNPSLEGIPREEFVELKKVLQAMDWNALSGRSWYAAKRFLSALIQDGLLSDNSLGSP